MVSKILSSTCLSLLCRNKVGICIGTFCSSTLLYTVVTFIKLQILSTFTNMSSVNNDNFSISFPTKIPFFLFSWTRCSTIVSVRGDGGHLFLVCDSGRGFQYLTIKYKSSMVFFVDILQQIREVSSYSQFADLKKKILNKCVHLVN